MNEDKAKQIIDYTLKDIFQIDNPFSLEKFQKRFAIDIPKVLEFNCLLSNRRTWAFASPKDKIVSPVAVDERFEEDEWMQEKDLNSMQDILNAWNDVNYQISEKYINSTNVLASDGVHNSDSVYQSVAIFDSKNIVFSYKIFNSNYMIASRDNSSCTLGIRVKDSIYCSSNFEVSWSNKVSRSMYVHDGYDLYECLFCSHIRSKKYCIANVQLEKEKYFELKKEVMKWILEDK